MNETNLQSRITLIMASFIVAACLAFFISGIAFDILLVFGLLVVFTSLLISVFADSPDKAKDYPAFMTFAAVVYMFISASAVKFIISRNSYSRFLDWLADFKILNSSIGSMTVLLIVFTFLYIAFINLLKGLNRETYFAAGQETNFGQRLRFLTALPLSMSVLFIQAAAVAAVAVFAALLKQPKTEIAQTEFFTGNFSLLVELPVLLLFLSCGRIVKKISASDTNQPARKTVIANEISADVVNNIEIEPEKISFEIKEASWEDENTVKTIEFSPQDFDRPAGFEKIAETISGFSSAKVILLTSNGGQGISVRLPVNIAIRLAHTGKKCLLADFDFKNHAVSDVFNIHSKKSVARTFYPSALKNLFIAPDFSRQQVLRSFELFKTALDVILIYLPYQTDSETCRQLLKYTDIKMLF